MSAFTLLSRLISHRHRFVFLATFLVFISLFGGWFDPAIAGRLSAWKVGILQQPSVGNAHYNLLSFGVAGAILCYFLVRATWADNRQLMVLLSAALLFLAFDFFLQLGIGRPAWVKWALDGANDFKATMNFANRYDISTQYLRSPDEGVTGDQLTWAERLGATFACVSFGFLWFIAGAAACLFASLSAVAEDTPRPWKYFPARWAALAGVIVFLQTIFPMMGQYYLWRGDEAAARNDTPAAEACYRHAIGLDQWYQIEPYAYAKIGALRKSSGDRRSPEARLALGLDMIARGFYPEGMDWLKQARTTDNPQLQNIVLDEIAQAAVTQGQNYYQNGAQGMAQKEWVLALQARPDKMGPSYMMGRSDQDLTNYAGAREWYLKTEAITKLGVIKALCLSAIGDTYYKSGQTELAREYYMKSLVSSYNLNFRGMKSLLDDYYK